MDATLDAIERVMKRYKKAKRIPVRNFVCTAPDDKMANSINLSEDARMYRWNSDTYCAIRDALRELGKI